MLASSTQFGTNVIGIGPGKTKTSGPHHPVFPLVRPLTLDDADSLKTLPRDGGHADGSRATALEVGGNGRLRRTTVYGVSAAMTQVFSIKVRTGQFLPPDDSDNARLRRARGEPKNELFGSENRSAQN